MKYALESLITTIHTPPKKHAPASLNGLQVCAWGRRMIHSVYVGGLTRELYSCDAEDGAPFRAHHVYFRSTLVDTTEPVYVGIQVSATEQELDFARVSVSVLSPQAAVTEVLKQVCTRYSVSEEGPADYERFVTSPLTVIPEPFLVQKPKNLPEAIALIGGYQFQAQAIVEATRAQRYAQSALQFMKPK